MPNTREKLIELLEDTRANAAWHHWGYEESADYLIANGVTFAEDNNVPSKWIPVTERLPTTFGEYIVACKDAFGEVYSDYADYDPFTKSWKTGLFLDDGEGVTHWMPLPEAPKE